MDENDIKEVFCIKRTGEVYTRTYSFGHWITESGSIKYGSPPNGTEEVAYNSLNYPLLQTLDNYVELLVEVTEDIAYIYLENYDMK